MSQTRLTIALALSLILIALASWVRFSRLSAVTVSNSATVSNPIVDRAKYEADVAQAVADLSATTTASSSAPQTDTGIISENLFTDYFGLVANGQATPENIDTLTSSYADTVSNLSTSGRIQPTDLTLVADSAISFTNYLNSLNEVYDRYRDSVSSQKDPDITSVNPGMMTWAKNTAKLYEKEVGELKTIPVPASFIEDHTKLVNNYLSSEAALEDVAGAETDPARAMSGIAVINQNVTDEQTILADMQNIVTKSGIISSNP